MKKICSLMICIVCIYLCACGHNPHFGFYSQTIFDKDMKVHFFYGEHEFGSDACFTHFELDENDNVKATTVNLSDHPYWNVFNVNGKWYVTLSHVSDYVLTDDGSGWKKESCTWIDPETSEHHRNFFINYDLVYPLKYPAESIKPLTDELLAQYYTEKIGQQVQTPDEVYKMPPIINGICDNTRYAVFCSYRRENYIITPDSTVNFFAVMARYDIVENKWIFNELAPGFNHWYICVGKNFLPFIDYWGTGKMGYVNYNENEGWTTEFSISFNKDYLYNQGMRNNPIAIDEEGKIHCMLRFGKEEFDVPFQLRYHVYDPKSSTPDVPIKDILIYEKK